MAYYFQDRQCTPSLQIPFAVADGTEGCSEDPQELVGKAQD